MQKLSERTKDFTDSVIRRMTRVSLQYGAVNLSQGFPDFDPPKEILDRLAEVSHENYHQYSITWGAQNFREALAEKQSRLMGRTIDPNGEIVVTCGSTEAMMAAMMTVTDPGDKVVIFLLFMKTMERIPFSPAHSLFMCPCIRLPSILIRMNWKPLLSSIPRRLFSAIRPIPAARYLLSRN